MEAVSPVLVEAGSPDLACNTTRHTIPMISLWRALVLALGLVLTLGLSRAAAQTRPVDQWSAATWRFGPFAVTPTIQLKNLGWDSNVFNDTAGPKSDFTTTANIQADWWLRLGRARLHGVDLFEGVYFATYSSQSGFNQRHDLTFLVPFNRLQPYVGGGYFNTNDRPGYEINARVRHTETGVNGGAIVRVSSRLDVDISGRQITYEYFDEDNPGQPYSTTLNHRAQNYGAQARYRLSSLTTLTLLADGVRERFDGSPERDNNGYRVLPGVEFDPHALIQGKARLGYRKLNTLTPGMPDFSGLVGSAELAYSLRGTTRFGAGGERDIYFSYETTEPFYIQTGFTLSVTQQVTGPWDVQARGAWYRLNYQRADLPDTPTLPERIDSYRTWGGGVGYRVGRDIRLGFNVDYSRRESIQQSQNYEALRGGMAVTYVLK